MNAIFSNKCGSQLLYLIFTWQLCLQKDGTLRTTSPAKGKRTAAQETAKPSVQDKEAQAVTVQLMIVENKEFAAKVTQLYGRHGYMKDDIVLVVVRKTSLRVFFNFHSLF